MNRKPWLSKSILLGLLLSITTPAFAELDASLLEMSEQMDGIDKQDFQSAIDRANTCTRARNFPCAETELAKATKASNSGHDKKTLLASQTGLKKEKQALADEIRRAEEKRLAQIRRDEEERYAQRKREEEREARLWKKKMDAHEEEGRRSTISYKAQLFGNLQNDINRSWAQAEAGSRGSSLEEDRAKAERLSAFNESISRMEADPNSDLNRNRREDERERAEDQRADSERAAKRESSKKPAAVNDTKRASDKSAKADAEENARKKQKADELKVQQEREKKRLDAERRSQELRDIAERKRVAAAEEAKQKAEKERQAQAEKQARAQYLQSIKTGSRLVATMCPGGEGKYFATGSRPRIKPEVVSCVDVRFRAYCPGSRQYSEGVAPIFVGLSGCFGDTYEINPTPGCKVDQVRIEVIEARECSN